MRRKIRAFGMLGALLGGGWGEGIYFIRRAWGGCLGERGRPRTRKRRPRPLPWGQASFKSREGPGGDAWAREDDPALEKRVVSLITELIP